MAFGRVTGEVAVAVCGCVITGGGIGFRFPSLGFVRLGAGLAAPAMDSPTSIAGNLCGLGSASLSLVPGSSSLPGVSCVISRLAVLRTGVELGISSTPSLGVPEPTSAGALALASLLSPAHACSVEEIGRAHV